MWETKGCECWSRGAGEGGWASVGQEVERGWALGGNDERDILCDLLCLEGGEE
jgi:hypothetical protein